MTTDPALFAGFVLATVALMLIPGPNWAVITANSVAHGTRYGLLTVAATSVAALLQLALVLLGLATAIATAGAALSWLRWFGVAYLVWLGVREWRAGGSDLAGVQAWPRGPLARGNLARRIVARGLAVALTNPKTLLFFAAFFPQFVSPAAPATPQIAWLGVTFMVINVGIDSLWAVLAGRLRPWLHRRPRARRRLTGGLLVGAGVGLGLAHAD